MKSLVVAVALVAMPLAARADGPAIDPAVVQLWDVVHTADGSVLKGVIIEEVPGTSLKVALIGGSTLVVQMTNVVKLERELNPAFQGRAPRAEGGGGGAAASPALSAPNGLRIGILPAIAVHSEIDETTLMFTSYVGWELGFDRWGLIPNVAALYALDTGIYGNDSFGAAAGLRAAYRGTTVSPFVGFALGVDFVSGDPSLSTAVVGGIELVVHRKIALVVEGRLQQGFGGTYTDVHKFAAVGMGVTIRL